VPTPCASSTKDSPSAATCARLAGSSAISSTCPLATAVCLCASNTPGGLFCFKYFK